MKAIVFTILLSFAGQLLFGQQLSEKTNAIHIDLANPINAVMPSVVWNTPRIERSNSVEESVTIDVEIRSITPLKEVRFELTSGGSSRGKAIPVVNPNLVNVKQVVHLTPGENNLTIVAINEKNGQVKSSRSILVGKDALADAVDANRKDYALIFATDNYENWTDLVNPINDARMIEKLLKEKYGFETEFITNASQEEMMNKIYDYNTRKFNPQDQLFIFIAGHGYFDETLGEGYVVAANSLLNDRGRTSYISHVLLRERINNIKCEHIFLAMDVCFGGTFDPVLARSRGLDAEEATDKAYMVKKLTKRTRKYLTSGSKEYVSDGVAGKNSPFAARFIQALRETGGGTGRILSLLELYPYFLRLPSEPRFGSFGTDDPASDFVFVAKQ